MVCPEITGTPVMRGENMIGRASLNLLTACILVSSSFGVLLVLGAWATSEPAESLTRGGVALGDGADPGSTVATPPPQTLAPTFRRIMVLRVYFADYPATSRYTLAQVEDFFDVGESPGNHLSKLWRDTSYGNIAIDAQVSDLYQLPGNRASYVTDCPEAGAPPCPGLPGAPESGDLCLGGQYDLVLTDAANNAPAGLDWSNLDAVMVLMAETNAAQFHRGQGGAPRNLPMGPGGPLESVQTAVFTENPSANDNQVWGRWAHEIGHAFQEGGPAHPSNYRNEFELMDSNYPGQSGVFEKQSGLAFPGWLPTSKYLVFDPVSGGGTANIWAEEYDPSGKPNVQAVKAKITDSLYYLISVRRRVLGDDQNGDFTPFGIPDEGVLIERVSEGSNPWVTVQGKGGDRNVLWKENDTYTSPTEGITVVIAGRLDPQGDNYQVIVRYNKQANQPDVALEPWRSPPGDTYETTDIWVDSPVNGYGTYRFGMWSDLHGGTVPRGNGDPPAVGLVNRVYARIRNIGTTTATNVVVHVQVTDPLGVGIAGSSGWLEIGSVDSASFPSLAAVAAGDHADVYVDWTPLVTLTPEEIEAGLFDFHSCLRVILDHVSGELVFGNQDGDEEQENIDLFDAVPASEGGTGAPFNAVVHLRNDDLANTKYFYLTYDRTVPADWDVDVNGGVLGLALAPDEVRDIPVTIKPVGPDPPLGSEFSVEIMASSQRYLTSELNSSDIHVEFHPLGGVVVDVRVERKPRLDAIVQETPNGYLVLGAFSVAEFSRFYDPNNPLRVSIVGVDANRSFIPMTLQVVAVDSTGSFQLLLPPGPVFTEVVCLFAGTDVLAPSSSRFTPLELSATVRVEPETLNLKSQGRWVTAIVTFDDEVAGMVNLGTLRLEGVSADWARVLDGHTILVKFSREALISVLAPGSSVTVCVKGQLTDGRGFAGCDTIRVIRPGK